jgi:hypothetical protein
MAEYEDALAAARLAVASAAEARERATAAVDRAARAMAHRDALRRARDPDDEQLQAAEQAVEAAEAEIDRAREAARGAAGREREAVRAFGQLADPREQVERLPDDLPLLLMPLRLETRFKDDQLLVRVYPDVWAVDAFEARLSTVEVASGARYWAMVWQTGGTRDGRLAAWRGLARSHGSGRAAWIVREYRPRHPGGRVDRPAAGGRSPVGGGLLGGRLARRR